MHGFTNTVGVVWGLTSVGGIRALSLAHSPSFGALIRMVARATPPLSPPNTHRVR